MRTYLNATEMNDYMVIGALLDSATRIRKEWSEHENMTKDEHKAIKTAETYLSKFYQSVLSRQDKKELTKISRRLGDFELKIMDKLTLNRLRGTWQEESKIVKIDREEFHDWCNMIMEVKCMDCKKDYGSCSLHDVFDSNFVPGSSYCMNNCKYAYPKLKKQKKVK